MSPRKSFSLEELKQVVKERNREVQLLHRISASIGSSLELGTVLKHIVEVVVEVTKADACLLYLISPKKDELILRASKNPHPRLIGRIAIGLGEGITGWVARERVPVVVPRNASDDPRFKIFHRLPEDRYQAFVSVPIMSKGEVVGVINVQHKRSKRYPEEKLALLTTIANQVGVAIENARLYDEMRQKARRLETLSQVSETVASSRLLEDVLQLIVTMTAQLMSSKISSIMLVDQDSGELRIAATQSLSEAYRRKPPLKIGQSMSGRAVQEQRPIYIPDVTADGGYFYRDLAKQEGLHSLLTVPMLMKERTIGVINVYTSMLYVFSDEEVKTLQSIANQAAVAIEHTRLLEKSFEMQEALEVRKLVERAKGFVMASRGLSEPEAFKLLQRQSMNLRKSMREIAEAIILSEELQRATQ